METTQNPAGNRGCSELGRGVSCCHSSHGKTMGLEALEGRAAVLAVKSLLARHTDNLEVPHGAIPASGSRNPCRILVITTPFHASLMNGVYWQISKRFISSEILKLTV